MWFKNRRAKCRQQQKANEGKTTNNNTQVTTPVRIKKSKSPCPDDVSPSNTPTPESVSTVESPTFKPVAPIKMESPPLHSSPSDMTSGSGMNASSIWSPASIPSMSEFSGQIGTNCMQRGTGGGYGMPTHHSQMGGYAAQNSLNYGPSSYYGQMDYMSSMQLPVMTSANAMSGSGVSPHSVQSYGSYGLPPTTQQVPRNNTPECLGNPGIPEYKDTSAAAPWPKFQVL